MSEVNFQKASADRIKDYFSAENNHRYLLADEVGLGKTIVARKTIENMADKIKCCYYVCGSLALAEENLFKLRPEKLRYSSDYRNLEYFAPEGKRRHDYAVALLSECDRLTMGFVREEYNKRLRWLMRFDKLYALYLTAEKKSDVQLNLKKDKGKGVPESLSNNLPVEYKNLFFNIQWLTDIVFWQKDKNEFAVRRSRGRNNEVIIKLKEFLLRNNAVNKTDAFIKKNRDFMYQLKKTDNADAVTDFLEKNEYKLLEEAEEIYNEAVGITEMSLISLTPMTSIKLSTPGKSEEKFLIKIIRKSWGIEENIEKVDINDIKNKERRSYLEDWQNFLAALLTNAPVMNPRFMPEERDLKAVKSVLARYTLNSSGADKNLIIVDEFQNYPDIFNGSQDTSVGLVAKELLYNENNYVLMLSATPFRYSTRVNDTESEMSDSDTADNDSVSGSKNIDKEVESILSYVLGKEEYNKWLNINKSRHKAMKKADIQCIENCTREQERILFGNGISRVERVNVPVDESDIVIPADETLFEDIMSYPALFLGNSFVREPSDGDKLIIDIQEGSIVDFCVCRSQDGKNVFCECAPEYIENRGLSTDDIYNDSIYDCVLVYTVYVNEENGYIELQLYNDADLKDEYIRKVKNINVPELYLKDTPYLFSFSEEYKFQGTTLTDGYIIKEKDIDNKSLPVKNARYAHLKKDLFGEDSRHTKLLFIPPSKPHYKLSGAFAGYDDDSTFFSKTLIFSRYNHTPRAMAAVLSFEAEAVNIASDEKYSKSIIYHDLRTGEITAEFRQEENIKAIINEYLDNGFEYHGNGDDTLALNGNIAGYFADLCIKRYGSETACERIFYDFEKTLTGIYKIFSTQSAYDIIKDVDSGGNYWDKIHTYCGQGCFRAVLDEYIFLLAEKNRFSEKNPVQQYEETVKAMNSSISIISDISNSIKTRDGIVMRTGFALGHYKGAGENNTSDARSLGNKLTAFNSPFRPFVFITTSVGQEGFDFHRYCRNIVHWSLIFDPVKFEQREGRINRYHGHNIRQNIGKKTNFELKYDFTDWAEMFAEFRDDKVDGMSPDWVFPANPDETLSKLTRKTYYYPFSREVDGYRKLREARSYYRALLGQNEISVIAEDNLVRLLEKSVNIEKFFIDINPLNKNLL